MTTAGGLKFTLHTDADMFITWLKHATKNISREDFKTPEGRTIDIQPIKTDRREILGGIT